MSLYLSIMTITINIIIIIPVGSATCTFIQTACSKWVFFVYSFIVEFVLVI